ncbi:MAG TPA: SpoIIE family protein phosphatase [Methylomirabilota bacterium]|nr:SpoIIE family protein phosphatase [Methylomirabilota bacterium]
MSKPLRVLLLEDSEFDAQLLVSLLKKGGYDPHYIRVETAEQFTSALQNERWDVILADYNLPQFSAPAALALLQQSGLDVPFIIVSGGIGENTAVAAMKAGAHDYLMKGNLARLVPAVDRELREADNRAGKKRTADALRQSELRYRTLWETATDAVLLLDTNCLIQFANPAVENVFGHKPSELVGQHISVLQPREAGEDPALSLERCVLHEAERKQGQLSETLGRHKDGRELQIEASFSNMEFESRIWFVCFIRDITSRKQTEQELRANQEQFRVAAEIQQHLFPKTAPNTVAFDISGRSRPADATGGDYFDYLPMKDGCIGLVVGDVTGHGVGPALIMAETRAYLRILSRGSADPGAILSHANQVLANDVGAERFVTLALLQLDPNDRCLRYVNAGHSPAYLLSADGNVRALLKRTGPPLGIQPSTQYECTEAIKLHPGELVVITTDGFEEAVAPDDSFFGAERVLDVVKRNRDRSAEEIIDALYEALSEFTEDLPQADDLTAIVAKVN